MKWLQGDTVTEQVRPWPAPVLSHDAFPGSTQGLPADDQGQGRDGAGALPSQGARSSRLGPSHAAQEKLRAGPPASTRPSSHARGSPCELAAGLQDTEKAGVTTVTSQLHRKSSLDPVPATLGPDFNQSGHRAETWLHRGETASALSSAGVASHALTHRTNSWLGAGAGRRITEHFF